MPSFLVFGVVNLLALLTLPLVDADSIYFLEEVSPLLVIGGLLDEEMKELLGFPFIEPPFYIVFSTDNYIISLVLPLPLLTYGFGVVGAVCFLDEAFFLCSLFELLLLSSGLSDFSIL